MAQQEEKHSQSPLAGKLQEGPDPDLNLAGIEPPSSAQAASFRLHGGFVSESRHLGLCFPDYCYEEIRVALPADFVSHDRLSTWVHERSENRLLGFELDSRDGNCPGRTLRAAGLTTEATADLCAKIAVPAWMNEYEILLAQYGFAPNLGGRKDAPTIDGAAMDRRIEKGLTAGALPSKEEWAASMPADWVARLIG